MADFDAIVVGSGISGGWVAKTLCERGLKTLVLERGSALDPAQDYTDHLDPWDRPHLDQPRPEDIAKHYPVQSTSYAFKASNAHLWIKDSDQPYELTEDAKFAWRRGAKVGGRSLLWGRASFRMAPHDFEANKRDGHGVDWPVRYDEIAAWYDAVEKFVGISGNRDGLAQLPDGPNMLPPFDLSCAELELKEALKANYSDRDLIITRVANLKRVTEEQRALGRGACQVRNQCFYGCSYGAYFSSNSATLPAAKATGNMTLLSDRLVTRLVHDPDTNRVSQVEVLNTATGVGETYSAKLIFVNASAISTALLLLGSATEDQPRGLANASDQVGRNLMDHVGGSSVQAHVPGIADRTTFGRRPTPGYVPRYRNFPDKTESYERGFAFQVYSYRNGASGQRPGIGKALKTKNQTPGGWHIVLDAFGEILPNPDNRVTLHPNRKDKFGQPIASIALKFRENEIALMDAAQSDAKDIFETAGFQHIQGNREGGQGQAGLRGRTHDMGTVRMGRDPKTSVLNGWNQSHDIPNLFVTDGSFMTSSAVQNPSLTYMAFSARAADHAATLFKAGAL